MVTVFFLFFFIEKGQSFNRNLHFCSCISPRIEKKECSQTLLILNIGTSRINVKHQKDIFRMS